MFARFCQVCVDVRDPVPPPVSAAMTCSESVSRRGVPPVMTDVTVEDGARRRRMVVSSERWAVRGGGGNVGTHPRS